MAKTIPLFFVIRRTLTVPFVDRLRSSQKKWRIFMRGFPNRLFCGHLNPKKSILAKELHDLFARILQWGFRQTCDPKVGDMVIQHDPLTGRAFHACIIVGIRDGKYYVNHAIRDKYFKNVEMKQVERVTFYEFVPL